MCPTYIHRSGLAVDAATLFRWHARPGAFERLVPPWEDVRTVGPPAAIRAGQVQSTRVRLGPLSVRWDARIEAVEDGRSFRDVQLAGPFGRWEHTHSMLPGEPGDFARSILEDRVEFSLPFGPLGAMLGRLGAERSVRRRLERMFAYRHRVTGSDLMRHANHAAAPPLTVVISGASGLVGRSLDAFLTTGGHRVRRLVRRAPRAAEEFAWDPVAGRVDARALAGADALVHLAGESIASGRWSAARKERIRSSRVDGTRAVADALRLAEPKPRVFVCASAIGFYGDRGDEQLDESSAAGSGFLADVCRAWEEQARGVAGARAVQCRFGVVLSPAGGALRKMLPPFRLGLGGRIGSGRQWMSWVALDDVVGAIHHALMRDDLRGAVNVVAPTPVTNAEFTRTLGRVLRRPTFFAVPAPAARLALGEMADELLIASQRVRPRELERSEFAFGWPELEGALRHVLGREEE